MKEEGGRQRVCENSGNWGDKGTRRRRAGGGETASFFTGTLDLGAQGTSRRGSGKRSERLEWESSGWRRASSLGTGAVTRREVK